MRARPCPFLSLPFFAAKRKPDPGPKRERQSRIPEYRLVVFTQNIPHARVERHPAMCVIPPAEIDKLVTAKQVTIGQQHRVPKELIREERAIVRSTDEVAGDV